MRKLAVALLAFAVGALAKSPSTWSGLLVDAGCHDRDVENLRTPPTQETAAARSPVKQVPGISVSAEVLKAERAEATLPDTPDHASRYSSASCAITADTKAFALLLQNGVLLDLDEGGNTLALESFQSTAAGREILNGKTGGLKPHATVTGLRQGDVLKAESVRFARPAN